MSVIGNNNINCPLRPFAKSLIGLLSLAFLLMLLHPLYARSAKLPISLQVALYSKILHYDKQLKNKKPVILIVSNSDAAQSVVNAFSKGGFNATQCTFAQLPNKIGAADVLYILPGAAAIQVAQHAKKTHKLLISADPVDVEKGSAALSLSLKKNGKPQIIVNVTASKAQGHSFSSQLLALAKIIR